MLITNDLVELNLEANNRLETIDMLAEMALRSKKIDDKSEFIKQVIHRENQTSTDLGDGIAIPHGKTDSVKEPFIIFAKLEKAIVWNEEENSKIDMVFMLGVPKNSESQVHLKIISQIAAKLIDEDFLENLRATNEKQFILENINGIKI